MRIPRGSRGQTLIEILIAIAVGTVIVTAVLALATRSSRNANFARNEEQASKLAEEGFEIIRNIRDVNVANSVVNYSPGTCAGSCTKWSDLYETGVDIPDTAPYGDEVKLLAPGVAPCTTLASWCIVGNPVVKETITNDNQNFTRKVFLADTSVDSGEVSNCHTADNGFDYHDSKQVTVAVSWDDPVGHHEVKAVSCINNI